MLESDYCPYCNHEIEPDDVVEVCDMNGNEQNELVECPNCGKHIRASFEPRIDMSLVSEEDYLEQLERKKEEYKKRKSKDDQAFKDYYEMMIKEVDEKIVEAKANIEENKNQEEEEED